MSPLVALASILASLALMPVLDRLVSTSFRRASTAVVLTVAVAFAATGAVGLVVVAERGKDSAFAALDERYGDIQQRGTLDSSSSAWKIDDVWYQCDSTKVYAQIAAGTEPTLTCFPTRRTADPFDPVVPR